LLDLFHNLLATHRGRHLVVYLDLRKWKTHALSGWRSFSSLCAGIQITGLDLSDERSIIIIQRKRLFHICFRALSLENKVDILSLGLDDVTLSPLHWQLLQGHTVVLSALLLSPRLRRLLKWIFYEVSVLIRSGVHRWSGLVETFTVFLALTIGHRGCTTWCLYAPYFLNFVNLPDYNLFHGHVCHSGALGMERWIVRTIYQKSGQSRWRICTPRLILINSCLSPLPLKTILGRSVYSLINHHLALDHEILTTQTSWS
jgi:hypothetical protein